MKALVTGAAGFIGSHLCRELSIKGYQVLGIDSMRDYYAQNLKMLRVKRILTPSKIAYRELDITNYDQIYKLIQQYKPDSIFHLAAQPGVRLPIAESQNYIQDNVVAHTNILQAAVVNQIPNFIYASSSSVYGNSELLPFSESQKNLIPISLYGASKLASENLTPYYLRKSNTRARGLRFFTVYGPWGRPDMAYFRLIASASDQEPFVLFGDGSVNRDFTYVDDITKSIVLLDAQLSSQDPGYSDVVNIGGGNPHSMHDLISAIELEMNLNIPISVSESNPSDSKITSSDTSYLDSLIGKRSFTDLSDGIRNVITWSQDSEVSKNLRRWASSTS